MATVYFGGYPYPFLPVSGAVVTAGQWGDLKQAAGAVSVGIYDATTYGIATSTGNGKDFFIGYSREHTADQLTYQLAGMKNPGKSQVFSGKDVESFEYSNPQKPQNEVWVYGYNGAPNSRGLQFRKGKATGIQIDLSGNPIFRVMHSTLRQEFWVVVPEDADDCEVGCEDGVDCEKYTNMLVEQINSSNEMKALGVKARTTLSTFELPSDTISRWRITLTDGCGDNGIATVQASVGRAGIVSLVTGDGNCVHTYEVCAAAQPASITPPRQYVLAECDSCPSGYTLVPAQDTYIVQRPLAGTENFTSDGNRDTYADTVGTAYGVGTDADKTFVGFNSSYATVQLRVTPGTVITALAADTVIQVASTEAHCISNTVPSAVAWTNVATSYRVQRELTITLPRTSCDVDENRLAELTAYVEQFADYVDESITVNPADEEDGFCADEYTISQWSVGCMDAACQSLDEATFLDFPGYDGEVFVVAPVADAADTGKRCGIEITAGYVDTKYGNCSFDPNDYYEMSPIYIMISSPTIYPFPQPYELTEAPSILRTQKGVIGRQSGEWVSREYIKAGAYEPFGQFWKEPRLREAFNSRRLQQVDRNAYYKIYYLTFKAKRTTQDQFKEKFEATIAIKETEIAKQQAFEAAFLGPLAKFGVVLERRDI